MEAASWLGPDIVRSLLLDKMPDMMRKDIEKLVEEAGAGIRKQPERFTRKEMSRRAAATAPAASLMAPTATLAQPSSADTAMAGDDMVSSTLVYLAKWKQSIKHSSSSDVCFVAGNGCL